ncbi:phospholipid/cholesterol/gamma-HCH transport system substrate-binding protein [Hymenobacter luteus]|uniref:Phospholipid/cholesterol/gamma-HCH transport system substrate-binding protein n=2 Tax=Hymenobacter TaxID=89966 RepID=A0A7W9SYV7_9BACT|nr:MlaD family protein [Hymenobacter latericoloratus]MBB4600266.1 phospholipid/cholesterol/gamma-HCH transport system substrate-binding protein [Hymenobacter latericoloratus]MBB6057424.1 phospholipid/cholesterol/gamma-HCH transport system substrate-binding protein [Hymenobacter luteus]
MSKEIKVALLGIVAVALLIVGFNFLKGSNILSTDRTYYAKYDNVDGLNVGNPVILNGIKVGQVKEMTLVPEEGNRVKVAVELQKGVTVGDSTVASLSGSLLGSKTITLFLGKNTKVYDGGEELKSYTVASITDAFQAKALPVLGTVDSTLIKVNGFLNKDAKVSLQATLQNAQGSTEALKNLLLMNQRNINQITSNMARLTADLNKTSAKFDRIAANFSTLSDSLKNAPVGPAMRKLNATMTEAQGTMTTLNRSLSDQQGSLGKLLRDSTLYNNLNATAASSNALLQDLKANPKNYVHFSVFGGGKAKQKTETTTKPNGEVEKETKTVVPATGAVVTPAAN